MKVIELFSGIGSQTAALKRLGIAHEVIGISEIDKYAIKSYEAIHGTVNNFGDITKIKELPYCDLLTYSFPCQDISVAGKQAGIAVGTRSGLLYEVERLLDGMNEKPKYLLLENVKNLVGKGHKADYDIWLKKLERMGYKNYWKVLNAKDYGIPQNRERVFVVSIKNDIEKKYVFPDKFDNGLRLKDMLEKEVDEKFYIKQEISEKLFLNLKDKEVNNCIRNGGKGSLDVKHTWDLCCVGMLDIKGTEQVRRVYAEEGISPTLNTMQGGNRQPKVLIDKSIKHCVAKNFEKELDEIAISEKDIYQAQCDSGWQDNKIGLKISQTIRANNNFHPCLDNNYKIRKLTPLECWRLMGFDDDDFNKAKSAGISDSQLYKQAGNSIVVDVLEAIFKNLFMEETNEKI